LTPRSTAVAVAALAAAAGCGDQDAPYEATDSPDGTAFAVESLAVPAGIGSAQAHLAMMPDGRVLLSWLEPGITSGHQLRFATFSAAGGWSDPGTVVSRERLFVNWADFPSVVAIDANLWVAHWLALQPDSYGAYDAWVSTSTDAGRTWSPGVALNEDQTEAEHGFVELFDSPDGPAAFWLDGRDLASWSFEEPDALLAVSLRLARITPEGRIAEREIVDAMVCDCCQPAVADSDGTPIVTYRDRTEDEIRDIVVRRLIDGAWTPPLDVGGERWQIEGCPVNGPAIAAAGRDVVVAWFTAADSTGRVRLARSTDGGNSFGAPLDLDADGALGQVDVVLMPGGAAVASWWRRDPDGGIDLVLGRTPPDGGAGPIRIVAHEQVSQPVDVPQMQRLDDGRLVVVWSSFDDEGLIRAAVVAAP
jgi:hypothetical protein